jgi:hypothetical protein
MTSPALAPLGTVETGRWELIRALAAVVDTRPDQSRGIVRALDLPPLEAAEHTATFVLWCPPFAALHLGPEGKLGGVGADRAGGFWRALGLTPPSEPDHLSHLLALYAHLGEAGQESDGAAASKLDRARSSLLTEHLWSWVPGYLGAVEGLGGAALSRWAALTREVLRREVRATSQAPALPLALREAPDPLHAGLDLDQLLDAILAPIRSGIVLTHPSLAAIARGRGIGYRAGERRFALRALLEQDPAGTLDGLASEAHRWLGRHRAEACTDPRIAAWWAARAQATATALTALRGRVSAV